MRLNLPIGQGQHLHAVTATRGFLIVSLRGLLFSIQLGLLVATGYWVQRSHHQAELYVSEYLRPTDPRSPAESKKGAEDLQKIQKFVATIGQRHIPATKTRLQSEPCFEQLVATFYAQVRLQDVRMSLNDQLKMNPPKDDEHLSESSTPAAGWLWKLALEFAHGDHNLAHHLVGVCSEPNSEIEWTEPIDLLQSERQQILSNVQAMIQTSNVSKSEADQIQDVIKSYLVSSHCPNASSKMYWPGSLAQNQRHLPAVFSSCLLYQDGVSSSAIEDIQERFRSLHRTDRLCKILDTRWAQADHLKIKDFDWTSAAAQSLMKTLSENPSICTADATFADDLRPLADRICPVMRSQAMDANTPAERLSVLHDAFIDYDTALFVKTHPQWKLANPCDPASSQDRLGGILQSSIQRRCPSGFNPARCARIIRNIENWVTDDLEQAEQYRQAQRFSRRTCVEHDPQVSVFRNACGLVEKMNLKKD